MTPLQIGLSILLNFVFPGLGQLYHSQFDPTRRTPAFWFVCVSGVLVWTFVGIFFLWVIAVFAAVEALINLSSPKQTVSGVLIALMIACCGTTYAASPGNAWVTSPSAPESSLFQGQWFKNDATGDWMYRPSVAEKKQWETADAIEQSMQGERCKCPPDCTLCDHTCTNCRCLQGVVLPPQQKKLKACEGGACAVPQKVQQRQPQRYYNSTRGRRGARACSSCR